jgi:F-type H+-transporting ATPase subunit b
MKILNPADTGWPAFRPRQAVRRLANTCPLSRTGLLWLAAGWQAMACAAFAAEGGNTNPLSINPDLAIFTAIIFVLLLLVLTKFAWRPMMEGLDKREKAIADMIDTAKRGTEEAAQKLAMYEDKLAAAATEAHELVNQARKDAEAAGEKLLTQAREQADRERERAMEDIHSAKNAAVREIADQSANIAFSLAQKLIQRELNPEDHRALVRETLDQFPSQN